MTDDKLKQVKFLHRVDHLEHLNARVSLMFMEYKVVKYTPKGFWINKYDITTHDKSYVGFQRWVSATGKRRFAYPSAKEALLAYIYRKQSHIRHLKTTLDVAEKCLNQAIKMRGQA